MDLTQDQQLTVAEVADLLGTSERFPRRLRRIRFVYVRVSFANAAEYQRRGVTAGPLPGLSGDRSRPRPLELHRARTPTQQPAFGGSDRHRPPRTPEPATGR